MSAGSAKDLAGVSAAQPRPGGGLSLRWNPVLLVVASIVPFLAFQSR
jgi:hypothetical protein